MIVSTFELVFAPITPTGGEVARRILQGYFLTITNLENKDLVYRLQFTITTVNPVDATRLLTNGVLLVDNGIKTATALPNTTNNVIALNAAAGPNPAVYTSRQFTIRARQTALAVLLPGNPGVDGFFTNPNTRFEIRGFAALTLPVKFGRAGFVAQSKTPVKVLLAPETRGAFLPVAGGDPVGFDFDNTATALPISSGQSLNEILPDQPIDDFENGLTSISPDVLDRVTVNIEDMSNEERGAMLMSLLKLTGRDDETIKRLAALQPQEA
ncbi:MAG: hypothetical protein OHK0022_53010 [Roseiflexaceae bacterium]